jgi:plastocyanin
MLRRALAVLATAALGMILPPSGSALAGGGCHEGATTGSGNEVDMIGACFTPTTLRVEPGETVTFVNRDGFAHMVGGTGWGHFEDLQAGDTFSATFDDAGIYPYACIYHPGMTGAIVVGDGTGAGNGQMVTAGVQAAAPDAAIEVQTVGAQAAEDRGGWLAAAAIGLVVGLAAGLLLRRPRRSSPDAS